MRKVLRRILTVFLATVILTVVVFVSFNKPVKTQASVLAVGGGIIAALTAFMAASGVTITNQGVESGDLQNVWENIAHDFSYDNKALQDWYGDGNAVNFLIGKDNAAKTVLISTQLATWFNELKSWLVETYSLSSTESVYFVNESLLLDKDGNLIPFVKPTGGGWYGGTIQNDGLLNYPLTANDSFNYILANGNSFSGILESNGSGGFVLYTYINNQLISTTSPSRLTSNVFVRYNSDNDIALQWMYASGSGVYVSGFIYSLNSVFNGETFTDISVSGELSDGYEDFDQALEDAKTDAGENGKIGINVGDIDVPIPVTEEGVIGSIIDNAIDNTLDGDLVGGYENEKEAETENNAETVPSVGDIENGVVIVDGLEDFFPFCIPFDFIALVNKFNASPEAPVLRWKMGFANVFNDEEIVLDFAPWETAANIFRICCLVGFCVFLILKTRNLIRG